MPPDATSSKAPIAFIHGLWLHSASWNNWIEFFRARGYAAVAADWPGDAESVEATRANAAATAGHGLAEIGERVAAQIRALPALPILIGHSFGGVVAQQLLCRGLAAAAVAIAPAPIKGVWQLPLPTLRTALPVLWNPLNVSRAIMPTAPQFRFGFTNALPETEAAELYARCAIPGPARPLFQAATATLNSNAATKVHLASEARGPLLLIAGAEDRSVPPVLVRSALKVHRKSPAVTEYKEFPGRGHSLTADSGWRELAEYSLGWLEEKGF